MDSRLLAQHLRGKLEQSPMLREPARLDALAPIAPPELDGLTATAILPSPPVEDALYVLRWRIMRAFADVHERAHGETVEADDEVCVDIIGYHAGRIAPFSAVEELWLEPETDLLYPGMREALVGAAVGTSCDVEVDFPAEHPEPHLRGARVVFATTIRAARRVTPAALEDPQVLAALEVRSTAELEESMSAWLVDEYEASCIEVIRHAALGAFAERLRHVVIPDAAVDEDIRVRWRKTEGRILQSAGVATAQQEHAQKSWLENESLRREIADAYRVSLGLNALVGGGVVEVSPEDAVRYFAFLGLGASPSPEQLLAELGRAPEEDRRALDEVIGRLKALEHVVAAVHIDVEYAALID